MPARGHRSVRDTTCRRLWAAACRRAARWPKRPACTPARTRRARVCGNARAAGRRASSLPSPRPGDRRAVQQVTPLSHHSASLTSNTFRAHASACSTSGMAAWQAVLLRARAEAAQRALRRRRGLPSQSRRPLGQGCPRAAGGQRQPCPRHAAEPAGHDRPGRRAMWRRRRSPDLRARGNVMGAGLCMIIAHNHRQSL